MSINPEFNRRIIMKKILILVLVSFMLFATACGANSPAEKASTPSSSETPAEGPEETVAPPEKANQTPVAPGVTELEPTLEINEEFVHITEDEFMEGWMGYSHAGYKYKLPKFYLDDVGKHSLMMMYEVENPGYIIGCFVGFFREKDYIERDLFNATADKLSQEEFWKKDEEIMNKLVKMIIFGVYERAYFDSMKDDLSALTQMSNNKVLAMDEDTVYIVSWVNKDVGANMEAKDKRIFEEMWEQIDEIIESISVHKLETY